MSWLGGFGTACLVGIEGTGSYGAGLARHITAAGARVVEAGRSDRQDRSRQGKSDDPYGLPAHDFGLLREGSRRGCQNVLSGRWQDLPVQEADYWYGTGGGTSYGYRRDFSIVIAELAATMPGISVVPYALLRKSNSGKPGTPAAARAPTASGPGPRTSTAISR